MNCEKAILRIPDFLDQRLPEGIGLELEAHLLECADCRRNFDEARQLWTALGDVGVSEPSSDLRRNFYERLDEFQQTGPAIERWNSLRLRWWGQVPFRQMVLGAACLVVGVLVGWSIHRETSNRRQIADLRAELGSMRQLVTISLLQQQSASDRLQGVTWSYRVAQSDIEVLAALLRTVNEDANVNVRLAAVDALRNFGDNPMTRDGAARSLAKQTSPLVQIAIIDLLVDLRHPDAVSPLNDLLRNPGTDGFVKKRVASALQKLG